MTEVKIIVRTADQARKAEVVMPRDKTAAEVIQAAVDNWALPTDTNYSIVNVSTGNSIAPAVRLEEKIVKDGDILEIQPVLVAGG
jgi:hypothetical protein